MRARWLPAAAALAPAAVVGLVAAGSWDTVLRFLWTQPFGRVDPVFGHDLGFYLFSLPILQLVQNLLTASTLVAVLVLGEAYRRAGLLGYQPGTGLQAPRPVRRHLLANLALFLTAWAAGYLLNRYALLAGSSGAVFGAGYTDVTVTRHALAGAAAATVAFAALLCWSLATERGRAVPFLVGGFLGAMVFVRGAWPFFVQHFIVAPNELALETPYLERNIAFTRDALGLTTFAESAHDPRPGLDMAAVQADRPTIDNIRLWDWQPLTRTFRQLQQIRTYYAFLDVDVDRYRLGSDYRQVLLSARELAADPPGQSTTWVNRRLQYTHGYGLVMAPAAAKTPDGRPVLLVEDLPPRSPPGLPVREPAIYYGEEIRLPHRRHEHPRVRLPARRRERLPALRGPRRGAARRLVPAPRLRLARARRRHPGLRLRHRRQPHPALALGRRPGRPDRALPAARQRSLPGGRPGPAVLDPGRLHDGLGLSLRRAAPEGFSYIRNSVKVVVDAYQGDVAFYVVDPNDPVLRVYRAAFPTLFRPLAAMPAGLVAHLRYPEDLFRVQLRAYAKYHMTVPRVFYNREDLWATPRERYGGAKVAMDPYYVLIRAAGRGPA